MTRDEIDAFASIVAGDPMIGDLMQDTGGCRKVRFAKPGTGKSGGYRVITSIGGAELPIFLLTVFGKGEKANLTEAERNGLAVLTGTLADTYRKKVVNMGAAR